MTNERQQTRRTSSGRHIPSYLPPGSFEGMSSPSKPSDERNEHISLPLAPLDSIYDDNYELPDDPLKDIRGYIQRRGFNTIFDVLEAELREVDVQRVRHVSRQQRELRKWLQSDGPGAILSLYIQTGVVCLCQRMYYAIVHSNIVSGSFDHVGREEPSEAFTRLQVGYRLFVRHNGLDVRCFNAVVICSTSYSFYSRFPIRYCCTVRLQLSQGNSRPSRPIGESSKFNFRNSFRRKHSPKPWLRRLKIASSHSFGFSYGARTQPHGEYCGRYSLLRKISPGQPISGTNWIFSVRKQNTQTRYRTITSTWSLRYIRVYHSSHESYG